MEIGGAKKVNKEGGRIFAEKEEDEFSPEKKDEIFAERNFRRGRIFAEDEFLSEEERNFLGRKFHQEEDAEHNHVISRPQKGNRRVKNIESVFSLSKLGQIRYC